MEKLKQVIESTLINNLETDWHKDTDGFIIASVELESIQTCSDYISKEIQQIAVCFHLYRNTTELPLDQAFNQFINERYK